MNILIMGLGFVGLTAALGFAEKGYAVYGFDTDSEKTALLEYGKLPFAEPGLAEALAKNLNKHFFIYNQLKETLLLDSVFICVGTPCNDQGHADLHYVYSAIDMAEHLLKPEVFKGVVVIKSTVPPATTKTRIIPYLREKGITAPVANNPEFLREGYCWEDFMNQDRIVCGVDDPAAEHMLRSIYTPFSAPLIFTSLNTAEFIKYLSNTMLASMISYSNEMSKIALAIGDISVKAAFKTLHMDKRWADASMKSYVYPGCGFGGYCLPKDLSAMIAQAKNYAVEPMLLESVQAINRSMPSFFASQLAGAANIGILGLSFKPHSDDVRDSPAAAIISSLSNQSQIYAYDPVANDLFQKAYDFPLHYCTSISEVCERAEVVMITTGWPQFNGVDKDYPHITFIDGRYML